MRVNSRRAITMKKAATSWRNSASGGKDAGADPNDRGFTMTYDNAFA
jgi:hypothetical protein